jgi:hypothetical protein
MPQINNSTLKTLNLDVFEIYTPPNLSNKQLNTQNIQVKWFWSLNISKPSKQNFQRSNHSNHHFLYQSNIYSNQMRPLTPSTLWSSKRQSFKIHSTTSKQSNLKTFYMHVWALTNWYSIRLEMWFHKQKNYTNAYAQCLKWHGHSHLLHDVLLPIMD